MPKMEITSKRTPDPKLKLMEQVREVLRYHALRIFDGKKLRSMDHTLYQAL
jgi:hypothetical protein